MLVLSLTELVDGKVYRKPFLGVPAMVMHLFFESIPMPLLSTITMIENHQLDIVRAQICPNITHIIHIIQTHQQMCPTLAPPGAPPLSLVAHRRELQPSPRNVSLLQELQQFFGVLDFAVAEDQRHVLWLINQLTVWLVMVQ